MEVLNIHPTDETPRVSLNPEEGLFKFSGNSYPENSTKFYGPILDWLRNFVTESSGTDRLTVEFSFDYFNTSSAKYILEILRLLHEYYSKGNEMQIQWHYMEDDTDMLEAGEDYRDSVQLPFELIERPDTY